jgi:hypothetical protein
MDWQHLLVFALIGVAAGYLALRARQAIRNRQYSGCGSCRGCPSGDKPTDAPSDLIAIDDGNTTTPRRS